MLKPTVICVNAVKHHFSQRVFQCTIACTLLLLGLTTSSIADDSSTTIRPLNDDVLREDFDRGIKPILQKHCYDCHSGETPEAGVDLERFNTLDLIRGSSSVWQQVRGLIKIGAMPPPESSELPTDDERLQASQWIDDVLNYVDCNECYAPAPVTVRRLNAVEYDHTVRDLFGVDLKPSKAVGFVTDEVGNGFDNQGEVLTLSSLALEKYFAAAHFVAEEVITKDRESLRRQSRNGTGIERGTTFDAQFDLAEGTYEVIARMEFGFEQDFSVDAQLLIDGEMVEQFVAPPSRETFRWTRQFSEGDHTVSIHFVDNEKIGGEGGQRRRLRIENVVVRGPESGQPRYPKEHRNVVVAHPDDGISVTEAAAKIAENLLRRAYRRPPTAESIHDVVSAIESSVAEGMSFEAAVAQGIEVALIAPEFFFRIENNSGIAAPSPTTTPATELVAPHDLATRLSFFLWSSIPDEELTIAAIDGSINNVDTMNAQIDRMLADPKLEQGLIEQFYGQWLGLRNLRTLQVDQEAFPAYNNRLTDAMLKETSLFCIDVTRNGKLLDLLSADYSYINPRLAELYGLQYDGRDAKEFYRGSQRRRSSENRSGAYEREDDFIRTTLDGNRRGILTQGSILTLTSNPTRTSPVKRGKWVLENIIGDPPPAAPPGVPALEAAGEGKGKLSLREQLELHRANPSCASCHKVMDPIGLGLENFNAVGQFREKDDDLPIDAKGQLADGRAFEGSGELLGLLLSDEEKFAEHFIRKMLTFALGRGLVRQDSCTVKKILDTTRESGFEVRQIIRAIATSDPFRYRVAVDESEQP
jgi:hypothetical protein